MQYRTLPGTSLRLSVVGFGCWAIGGKWWGPVDDRVSKRAVARAVERGINWFDTAPLYGEGHADRVLVDALGPRRHDLVLATKVGPRWDSDDGHAHCDLSAANVRRDVEGSLERLRIDCIPLLQIHWPCERGTAFEETFSALDDLVREGKVLHYGLCNYTAADLARACEIGSVRSLQKPYSMVRRELERELSSPAMNRVAVLVYETLCRGLLTGKFASRPTFPTSDMRARDDRFAEPAFSRIRALVSALRIVARRLAVPPAAVATAWTLRDDRVSAAIVGAKTEMQVDENVRAVELLGRSRLWEVLEPHVDACRV
jgi:aryl-alcohol dehydrogenase-like predicted oxidoreductase